MVGRSGSGRELFLAAGRVPVGPQAGITLDAKLGPAEKLKSSRTAAAGRRTRPADLRDYRLLRGLCVAHYADFYELRHVLILGRVTSGEGGNIILAARRTCCKRSFRSWLRSSRCTCPMNQAAGGQAVAAASLPIIK